MTNTSFITKINTKRLLISESKPPISTRNNDLSISNRVKMKNTQNQMITEEKKRREAFKFNANLSDRDIRQIRATAQGMTTYQYESFLKEIGIEY